MMSTKMNTEFLFPFNSTFFHFSVFLDQTILIIVNYFCETCTFLTSLWSKEKIKCGPTKAVSLLHSPYFQTLFSIRDLFQYPNLKNARHSWKRHNQTFPLWILLFCTAVQGATYLCLFNPFSGVINP